MMMWQKITLGSKIKELTDYTANGSFESLRVNVTYYHEHNFAALIRTTDLGKKLFNPERFTDEKGYKFLKKVHLKGKEILIANVGSLGKVYRVPEYNMPMVLAPNMYLVRFNEEVNEDFIYQYFISDFFKNSLLQKIGSTTLQAINKDNLRSIELKLPPKPEQTRIAEILSTADAAIAQTEALIAKYQRIKTGLMQDLLTRGIDANGNIRSKATHRFVVKNGIEVPEEWAVVRLKDCSKFLDNRRRPIKEADRKNMTGEFPYYGASGIIDYINDYIFDEELILLGEDGENILSRNLPLAFIGKGKYWVNNHAHVIKPNEDMNIVYLCMQLEAFDYAPLNTSSAQPKITKSKVEEIFIAKPLKDEQDKIAEKLHCIDNYLKTEINQLFKLHSLKTGLMQDLLSGRKRLNL